MTCVVKQYKEWIFIIYTQPENDFKFFVNRYDTLEQKQLVAVGHMVARVFEKQKRI